jgi:hypothetical protein
MRLFSESFTGEDVLNFMKYFLLICLLLFPALAAAAKNSDWVGIYTFDEESWDETRERTSYWFRLEVEETDGKLTAVYSDGVNGTLTRRFKLSVKAEDKKARFYFARSLARVDGAEETCTESEFAGGALLFEFEQSTVDGKPVIYTIWQKMNLAVRTESGGISGEKNVFFRKSSIKRYPEVPVSESGRYLTIAHGIAANSFLKPKKGGHQV